MLQTKDWSAGFTLIELLVVTVILGVLAATAVAKYDDLQATAHTSVLIVVKSAMETAAATVNAKARSAGLEKDADTIVVNEYGEDISLGFGYPKTTWAGTWENLMNFSSFSFNALGSSSVCDSVICIDESHDSGQGNSASATALLVYPKGYTQGDNCFVFYEYAEMRSTRPLIGIVDRGC